MSETAQMSQPRIDPRDHEQFQRLTEPYQRELLVHCYRMLGSVQDAEDILQETWLRAWHRLDTFAGRGSLRAWLYKIATNAALDALEKRRIRMLPTAALAPADPQQPLPEPTKAFEWLEPLPDTFIDPHPTVNPEAYYEIRESITLAFLAALQHLPGRQRAVLLLRDVLGWRANQVAELLDMTVVAVNSALQRARATMQMHQTADLPFKLGTSTTDEQTAALLTRYVQAWEAADAMRLVALLREDAALTMPPLPVWYLGRAAIQHFLATYLFAGQAQNRFRMVATRANGCPACAIYQRDEEGVYRPGGLQILIIKQGQIVQLHDFLAFDPQLFSRFALPLVG